MLSSNPTFQNWYTDTMDIYRVTETSSGNITRQERTLVAEAVPCRVYSPQKNAPSMKDTAARIQAAEKLACDLTVDIQAGDELLVTRGGNLGMQNPPLRYFAGQPQKYYDPIGGVMSGLEHTEVGLLLEEIIR